MESLKSCCNCVEGDSSYGFTPQLDYGTRIHQVHWSHQCR